MWSKEYLSQKPETIPMKNTDWQGGEQINR